jgi:hypothetical protein
MVRTIAVTLFALSAFAAAPVPKKDTKPVYYCPTKAETRLVYEEDSGEQVYSVKKVEDREGIKTVWVDRVVDNKPVPYAVWKASSSGVSWVQAGNRKIDPPAWEIKLPPGPDQKWEDDLGGSRITSGTESVKVPAGTYECVRVEGIARPGNGKERHVVLWYAPDIGLVKCTIDGKAFKTLIKVDAPR